MDVIEPIVNIVKDVVPTVKKYFKYQICHNDYVNEFKEMQTQLKRRRQDVEEELHAQLRQPGKIAKKEVQAWLEKADQETTEKVVEDLICKGGFLTYICSSRKLDKRTQSLIEGIFKQGEKYTSADESLVVDTPSIEYWATVFEEKQERLKHQKEDVEANLKTQRMQPGKIARKEVEEWLEKAGQQIGIKVEGLINQGGCSSLSNLRRKIEELRQILEQGKQFTNATVILVRDDHSIKGFPLLVETCSGRDDIQEKILKWLKGDKVTRIAVSGMGGVGKTTIMKNVHNQLLIESKFENVIWIASSLKLEREPDHENETKLAALISQSPQFLVKAGIALEKLPEEHEWRENLLKISTIPEAFFEHMLGLKIVDLSNSWQLSRLPSSISKLEKLTTLLLRQCNSLREVPALSNLVGLKKLDLSWTSIEELPQGLNMLTNLKYLGLDGRLSETLDKPLQNLSKLQHLLVTADPSAKTEFKWETIGIWGKLQNLEKLHLVSLHNSNMVFGEVGAIAESASLPAGTFSSLQYISVWHCNKIKKLCSDLKSVFDEEGLGLSPRVPPTSFFSLKEIRVAVCDQLKKVFSSGWLLCYFQSLETIEVSSCSQMEELISSSAHEEEKVTLPKLEELKLTRLPLLKSICSSSSVLICDSIQSLMISMCEKLNRIPLNFLLLDNAQSSHPPSLEEICGIPQRMVGIIGMGPSQCKRHPFPLLHIFANVLGAVQQM
ncbi:hypothetical protein SLEP1_g45170 [Rubroshorea leprosula]|uniref:NB-ARC domain-containing protein n=1 Tax=Rubroshorea leprosula TaxID=152421 RepID=A0AAV5LJV8_9ROSI|nr:hypothetical protein SLEP1_g45170 [Rubroshorea leprosula]